MKRITYIIFALASLALVGCAHRRPQYGTLAYQIPASCLLKPVQLVGCDQGNPPRCAKVTVAYKHDCAQLDLKNSEIEK